MTGAYIVGIDMIPFGRYPNRTVAELGAEAVLLALDDAPPLRIGDIEAVYCGNQLQAHAMVGQQVMRQVGETGVPVVNVADACASGATAFREACLMVRAGLYDLVLALGVESMGRGLLETPRRNQDFAEEGVVGSLTTPAMFAQIGVAHQLRYGTTVEQFARVAVKNHHHATLNPKAFSRRETPLSEVLASEMIAYPNTKLMCSMNVDGAAAAVVASEAAVRRWGLGARAVRVRASALTSNRFTPHEGALTDFSQVTRDCARRAYEEAGVGASDMDLVELHDCFATAELVHYENLGLCAEGEAGALIDSGATAIGGRTPVNLSGGLLSKGHPLGATGIANLYEAALHLRGEAGERQVEGARLAMAHVVGGLPDIGSACAIHILERA
jgi:acetyl-CoA acetyltransferase